MSNSIPQGWHKGIFSDVVKLDYGKSPKDVFDVNGKYSVIGTGGVTGLTNSFLHKGNTTVIGRKGTINSPSFITSKFWPIDTTYFVSEHKNVDPKWFYYLVHSIDLTRFNEASGVPSLNRDTLYAIPHVFPPITEQKKIASVLTAVDNVIESTQAQINKLKDLKTGMMQELLTKGIDHTEFKDSPMGRIPKEWEVKELNEIVDQSKPITYGIVQAGPHVDEGVPYIRVSDMVGRELRTEGMMRTSTVIAEKFKRSSVDEGDIVYALRGVIGHVQIVPKSLAGANLTQGTARISRSNFILPEYLIWALKSPYVAFQNDTEAKGSTFREVTLASLRAINICVPSKTEQKEIACALDSIQTSQDQLEDKLSNIKSIKKALMQDLLTGKVRVKVD